MPLLKTKGAASAQGFGIFKVKNAVVGQQAYTTPGTYSWTCPAGVTSVSVVCVGGGGGGGSYVNATSIGGTGGEGGELVYINNFTVVPGVTYPVIVGAGGTGSNFGNNNSTAGGPSSFDASTLYAYGGARGLDSASGVRQGYGGGGAMGYTGVRALQGSQSAGTGGGGSAGANSETGYPSAAGGGGGVGILGQGISGAAPISDHGAGGKGGSNGGDGVSGFNTGTGGSGGFYGGGGGASLFNGTYGGSGYSGAVRIIWPGTTRQFPSTNTGDL